MSHEAVKRAQAEAEHQASIVADVRRYLADWRRTDAETTLRLIANRVGFYLAPAGAPVPVDGEET